MTAFGRLQRDTYNYGASGEAGDANCANLRAKEMGTMHEGNTEERNAEHQRRYQAAVEALATAYNTYLDWQEQDGDWETFLDWVTDEGGPRAKSE